MYQLRYRPKFNAYTEREITFSWLNRSQSVERRLRETAASIFRRYLSIRLPGGWRIQLTRDL